jgi:hypothetical protein
VGYRDQAQPSSVNGRQGCRHFASAEYFDIPQTFRSNSSRLTTLAGPRAHVSQDFDFTLAERDFLPVTLGGVMVEVDVQRPEHETVVGGMNTSQDGPDPSEELHQRANGFVIVIVGSQAQSLKLILLLTARRENDDGGA